MSSVERVRLDAQGRVRVPAHMRRSLGLNEGSELFARLEDSRLVLETHEGAWLRLRSLFDHVVSSSSVVDELLRERQREAAIEDSR